MEFETEYELFIRKQLKKRKGESHRRLKEGHGHAERLFLEQVWWPAVGSFQFLHAEYEVEDFKDGSRFLDFAYIRPPYCICIEIDGYKTHQREISRWQFTDDRLRQNHLVLDEWKVFRFSYDIVNEKPRQCQQFLQQMMGKWFGNGSNSETDAGLTLHEKEIIRFTQSAGKPITPSDICSLLRIGVKRSRKLLHGLVDKQIMCPASGTSRVYRYMLHSSWGSSRG